MATDTELNKNTDKHIPSTVWILGIISMLMDISSEIIHSLLPLFLLQVLGANIITIGTIEGLAEATALIMKIFSGALSDYLGKRQLLVLWGYSISAITKPLFIFTHSINVVFLARFFDRFGKGIRGAPRDALITDYTHKQHRGAAFGLRQSMDSLGAALGPLFAMILMVMLHNNFRHVFAFALLPAILAILLIVRKVKDAPNHQANGSPHVVDLSDLKKMGPYYWWVVFISSLITLARFSEAFLILRAYEGGMPLAAVPLILVPMNLVYAFTAYPFGKIADRVSSTGLLALSLTVLIIANYLFATSAHWTHIYAGVVLWGLHLGMTQGLLAAMVANASPARMRGTGFGFFYFTNGIALFFASFLAGLIWQYWGPAYTFYIGIAFCTLAFAGLLFKPQPYPVQPFK